MWEASSFSKGALSTVPWECAGELSAPCPCEFTVWEGLTDIQPGAGAQWPRKMLRAVQGQVLSISLF